MSEFLWSEVGEVERVSIRKQAKEIMDNFSDKLANVDMDSLEHFIERESGERKEGEGLEMDSVFRKIMFENAPSKNDDFILGESKKW